MNKKRQAEPDETETDMGVSIEMVASVADEAPRHWEHATWGVYDLWACAYCPFDTLDGEEAIAVHYRTEHAPPPPPPVERIQIYDRWGNPVK